MVIFPVPQTHSLTLEEAVMISPRVKHFVCRLREPASFSYLPGQFITLHFQKGEQSFRRSYSIANSLEENKIEFAAAFVEEGPGTAFLFGLKPGDPLEMTGPFGRLVLKEPHPQRYILVATSTGVTPYRAMREALKQVLAENPLTEVVILEGVQYRDHLLYAEDFLDFAKHPRVSFRAYLSQEKESQAAHEYLGHVQAAFPDLALDPRQDRIYLCGNPNMIDESFLNLKERGFEVTQIVREKYISAKS